MVTLHWQGCLKRDDKQKMFTKSGSELAGSQPLTAMMCKNREMLVNQVFVFLEFAVDLSSKEVLVEAAYGASVWAQR